MIPTLKRYTAIGLPYHGLALNDSLTIPDGTLTTHGDGPALVCRHPSAPGASRNAAQQARDTAKGYSWRDYLLLTGSVRYVSGADVSIGGNGWLYCDSNGVPWQMTVNQLPESGNVIAIQVWRRALFGRFGRDYSGITDELLATYNYTLSLPTWYSGTRTVTDFMQAFSLRLDHISVVPNEAGDNVYLNLFTTDGIFRGEFPELEITGTTGSSVRGLAGLLTITVSGAGDTSGSGSGISAAFNFTHDIADLYLSRTVTNSDSGATSWSDDWSSASVIPTPDPTGLGQTVDWVASITYGITGTTVQTITDEAITETLIYRTHDGDCKRHKVLRDNEVTTYSASGGYTQTVRWESEEVPGVPGTYRWTNPVCQSASWDATLQITVERDDAHIEHFTVFDLVTTGINAVRDYDENSYSCREPPPGFTCWGLATASPPCTNPTTVVNSLIVNSVDYSGTAVDRVDELDIFTGIKLDAYNLAQTQITWNQSNDTTRNLRRDIVSASRLHGTAIQYTDTTPYSKPVDPDENRGFPFGFSYQAVTDEWTDPGNDAQYL